MKRGTTRHPKLYDLMEALDIKSRPLAIGYLEMLWHFAAEYAPQGDIGRYSTGRIEGAMDWRGTRGRLLEALTTSGWVDVGEDTTNSWVGIKTKTMLFVHDWEDHCDESVRRKLKRSGLSFLKYTRKVTGQTPDSVRHRARESSTAIAIAKPMPPPPPHADTETATPSNGNGRRRQYPELPKTKTEIGKHFPDVGDGFLHRLYLKSCEAAKKGGCDPKLITDALLAMTVERCTKKHQESAGLYLDTVPSVILTWAETEEK